MGAQLEHSKSMKMVRAHEQLKWMNLEWKEWSRSEKGENG